MTIKHHRPGDAVHIVHRWDHGFTWVAHPDEEMVRASHALVTDAGVWIVDPVDTAGLDEELTTTGPIAGVVVLKNTHWRDADRIATRHDVPIYTPPGFDQSSVDARVEPFETTLGDTAFELVWTKDGRMWKEGILYHPTRNTLVVGDLLCTALFPATEGQLEVVPFFRFSPPNEALQGLAVDRILVGHGRPIIEDAETRLEETLTTARDGALTAILTKGIPTLARVIVDDIRS